MLKPVYGGNKMVGQGKGGKGLGKGGIRPHRRVLRDNILGVTKPSIRRIALAGGVPRMSGLVYEDTRSILKVYMENIMHAAVAYMEHGRRTILSSEDFKMAYEKVTGKKYYGSAPEKTCDFFKSKKGKKKHSPGKLAVKKIKHYQKQKDCFMIRMLPFDRLVREIGQDFKDDLKYSKNFINMFHSACEKYLIDLFRDSFELAVNAGRLTLFAKDLQLVRRIRGERS